MRANTYLGILGSSSRAYLAARPCARLAKANSCALTIPNRSPREAWSAVYHVACKAFCARAGRQTLSLDDCRQAYAMPRRCDEPAPICLGIAPLRSVFVVKST